MQGKQLLAAAPAVLFGTWRGRGRKKHYSSFLFFFIITLLVLV
jgi:hypothetical protein